MLTSVPYSLNEPRTMFYCFNPNCSHPENSNDAIICQSCGSPLLLKERYQAVKIINRGKKSTTFKVLDRSSFSHLFYYLKQFIGNNYSLNNFSKLTQELYNLNNYCAIPKTLETLAIEENLYIVQEWVEGINSAQIVDREGVFSADRVWQLLENILPVLKFIHDRCLVHRDLKPANIIYNPTSKQYFLVDWTSLGQFLDSDSLNRAIGSPEYVAPEQLKGLGIAASDLYSLGVSCLYLLTGMSPFNSIDTANNCWIWRDYWLEYRENSVDRDRIERLSNIIDKLIAPNLSASPTEATSDRYICADTVLRMMGSNRSIFFN